jgi:hypothetical protein
MKTYHELGVVVKGVLGGGTLGGDLDRGLAELLARLAEAGEGRLQPGHKRSHPHHLQGEKMII